MADRERGGPDAARAALEGSTVCVMGYGDHGGGAGMVDFLTAMGARVVLTEARPRSAFSDEVLAHLDSVLETAHFGGHDDSHLDGADLLVRNPAVRFGHPLLAAARGRVPGLRLVQVGGPWPPPLAARIDRLVIGSAVAQVRGLTRGQLAALYRRAAAVLVPSEAEGFGLPVVEALACGAAVVASDIPALREVAGDAAEGVR